MNVDLMEQWYKPLLFFVLQLEPRQKVPGVEICLVGKRKTKRVLQNTSEGNCCRKRK